MNRNEIMKLLTFIPLQGLHQKPDNKSYFFWRKILEPPIFLDLFSEKRFHFLFKFLYFVDNESYDEATCSYKRMYKLKPILDHVNVKFRRIYTPEGDVSVDEFLMMLKVCIPSRHAKLGIKLF
jgi:hypothetical protein